MNKFAKILSIIVITIMAIPIILSGSCFMGVIAIIPATIIRDWLKLPSEIANNMIIVFAIIGILVLLFFVIKLYIKLIKDIKKS